MRKFLFAICLIGTYCIAQEVKAQEVSLTLDKVLEIALDNNLGLKIARNNEQISLQALRASNANFLPTINANGATGNTTSDVNQQLSDKRTIQQNNAQSSVRNASLVLNYTLFDGLKMFALRDLALANNAYSETSLKQDILNTIETVSLAYMELYRAIAQQDALQEVLTISTERIKIAENKLNVGIAPKTVVLQSKLDFNAQQSELLRITAQIPQLQAQLKEVMGSPLHPNIKPIGNFDWGYVPNEQRIKNAIESSNNTVLMSKSVLAAKEAEVRSIKSSFLPKLDFVSSYNYNKAQNQAGFLLVNQNQGYTYGFTVSMPIFSGFTASRGLKIAQLAAVNAELEYSQVVNQIQVELIAALTTYRLNLSLLQLEKDNVDLAKENAAIALERFRQSLTDIQELRSAQESLQQAYFRLIGAEFETKQAELRLRNLSGDLVK